MLELLARKRVFIGTLYLVAIVVFNNPQMNLWWIGFGLAMIGEAIRTWASGYIIKNEELSCLGPYSIVRNPLYFGSFFLGMGLTLMSGARWLILLYPILFLPVYFETIRREEKALREKFNVEHENYCGRVPSFFPNPALYRPAGSEWDLQRVIYVHKEWTNWFLLAGLASYFYFLLQAGTHLL